MKTNINIPRSIVAVLALGVIIVTSFASEGGGNWQQTGTSSGDDCRNIGFEMCDGDCTHYVDWECESFGGSECTVGATMQVPMDSESCEYFGFGFCICPSGF